PGGGPVAAEPLELSGACTERSVQVERGDRPTRAFPGSIVVARDQDDGAVEALDEAGGDEADHAFVPVLPPDDESAPAAPILGPGLDRSSSLAEDCLLHGLTIAIELLQPVGEVGRLGGVLGQDQLERDVGPPKPAGGVDAR